MKGNDLEHPELFLQDGLPACGSVVHDHGQYAMHDFHPSLCICASIQATLALSIASGIPACPPTSSTQPFSVPLC